MEIPFIGGAYQGRSSNLNAQVCQNLYPVVDQQGGKVGALMNTPGLVLFSSPAAGVAAEVRGLVVKGASLYAVIGNTVYKVETDGSFTACAGALVTSTGKVWMEQNGAQVMIVDGAQGYIVVGTTVTAIASPGFSTPSCLAYQDGYFMYGLAGTNQMGISGSYDGTTYDAADFASAEAKPDLLLAIISNDRMVWMICSQHYEVWYNSGATNFPFERVSGAASNIGCVAAGSAAVRQGVVVWLDESRYVRINNGYGADKISTPQIDYALGKLGTVSDAIAFMYSQEGATFYVLTFPTEGKTFVYDFSSQIWHTRASGETDIRHRANCYFSFNGKHIVGDFADGNLYEYSLSKFTDNGSLLRRVRAAQAVVNDRKRIFHNSFEVEFEAGVGLALDDPDILLGSDPQACLEWSDDGGHIWSNEHWTGIGKIGQYRNRAIWRRLGNSRDRIYRVTVTDPVKTVMIGAHLDAAGGNT